MTDQDNKSPVAAVSPCARHARCWQLAEPVPAGEPPRPWCCAVCHPPAARLYVRWDTGKLEHVVSPAGASSTINPTPPTADPGAPEEAQELCLFEAAA